MYFLTSTCSEASSPFWTEPRLQELAKFDAGKQSSATLNQHIRLISNRNAWRVARTTRGEPHFDNFADITLIVPDSVQETITTSQRHMAYENKSMKKAKSLKKRTIFLAYPLPLSDKLGSHVMRDSSEPRRVQFRLNKSQTYNDPFLVTTNNFQQSSQSTKVGADPSIIVGIARLPHFV